MNAFILITSCLDELAAQYNRSRLFSVLISLAEKKIHVISEKNMACQQLRKSVNVSFPCVINTQPGIH